MVVVAVCCCECFEFVDSLENKSIKQMKTDEWSELRVICGWQLAPTARMGVAVIRLRNHIKPLFEFLDGETLFRSAMSLPFRWYVGVVPRAAIFREPSFWSTRRCCGRFFG